MKNIQEIREKNPSQKPVFDITDLSAAKDYITTITILENISDAIFILNKDGRIEYTNGNALKILRTTLKDIIGRFIDEIIIDANDLEIDDSSINIRGLAGQKRLIEKLNGGIFGDINASLVNEDHVLPVVLNFNIINDKYGEVCYIIVSAKDISYRKVLEKELKQQQALSISRDRLRALGALSVGLMHELGQPMTTLKLKLEMMYSKFHHNMETDNKTLHEIKDMMDLVNRMSCTFQNIRMFAHQTEDKTLSIVGIKSVIENACKLVSYDFKKRNINILIKVGEQLPLIIANPILIEQVFVNLLTNARDAFDNMDQNSNKKMNREKEIRISTKISQDKWISIFVEDNAGGIDEKIKNEIFEPFFTTKEPGKSSGVGLSIIKSIITSIGGDIKVVVEKSVGTKFILRIPVNQTDEKTQLFNLIELLHQS